MSKAFFICVFLISLLMGGMARAQEEKVWVQVEALPNAAEAQERAQAYSTLFPETVGFKLPSGWFAIALGPYSVAEGAAQLTGLKRERLIPADSFIADGTDFRDQFWPAGATPVAPEAVSETPAVEPAPEVAAAEPAPQPIPDETPSEARASEAELSRADRELLQTAMQWFGFYEGKIDGAFGRGTRGSMAAWQEAFGFEATGILTTSQRATLVANFQADQAEFGFAPVNEAKAGIDVTLPLGLVQFDHYEPPFVHFNEKNGSGLKIVLISQPGDQAALYGLYDLVQTLSVMPLNGERQRGEKSFRISGTSDKIASTAYAELRAGLIKGWMVISTPDKAERDARVIQTIEASFAGQSTVALDPGMVPMDAAVKQGLLAGLEVRRPKLSRSGIFVDDMGTVITSTEAVASCGRITIDRVHEATLTASDPAMGVAILTPKQKLAPLSFAKLQDAPDRVGTEVAVAGYSWEDRLPAPAMTFGILEEITGLNGETDMKRLSMQVLPGDAGGPLVDGTGAVLGMLLPDAPQGGKTLPEGVAFARASSALVAALQKAGVTPSLSNQSTALAPEDLSRLATGMTALVSCWD